MNTRVMVVGGLALAMMLTAGGLLATQHSRQRLSPPGVKIAVEAVYAQDNTKSNAVPFFISSNRVDLPIRVAGMTSLVFNVDKVTWEWLPKDTVFGTRYYIEPQGTWNQLGVVLMGSDRTSLHQPEYCLTGQGFQIRSSDIVVIPIQRPHPYELRVNRMLLRKRINNQDVAAVFFYWFVSDSEIATSHQSRMMSLAKDMLKTGILRRWAYVTCFRLGHPGDEEAMTQAMKDFLSDAVPEFQITTGPPIGNQAAAPK